MKQEKHDYLKKIIQQYDIKEKNIINIIDKMSKMSYQARNLGKAAKIYDKMLRDDDCTIILTLAGSLFSAGLKKVVIDLIENNMIDVIVSSGANVVDMDFFEALGFKHYLGDPNSDDNKLQQLGINRIYDTYINDYELCICDNTIKTIADSLIKRPYSSREFIIEMGKYLEKNEYKSKNSVLFSAYKKDLPIFVPAFSDCSAGFGLLSHQRRNSNNHVTIDSIKDFRELVRIVLDSKETGIIVIGGGVPKNFVQDAVLGGEVDENGHLINKARLHKYAIQISVADERDGSLSSSTFREAYSWGKTDLNNEQMVFSEATISFPLIASYCYNIGSWKKRGNHRINSIFKK